MNSPGQSVSGPQAQARPFLLQEALTGLDRVSSRHWRKGPGASFARKDLSFGQMHMVMVLHELGPLTVGQLSDMLAVSMPSVSSMLDRLEEHGLAERQRDDSDRRLVHVRLTARGEAEAEEAAGFRRDATSRVLQQFSDHELRALLTVVEAVERTISCLDQEL
ncbi:MAG: MarR family winged helix-turn-helix transcriptional regulator [Candidatus Dormibacteria bacterium]